MTVNIYAIYLTYLTLYQLALSVRKMVSTTKFDGSGAATRRLRVLEEELPISSVLSLDLNEQMLDWMNVWLHGQRERLRLLEFSQTIRSTTLRPKIRITFIWLLIEEFPGNNRDMITGKYRTFDSITKRGRRTFTCTIFGRKIQFTGIVGRAQVTQDGTDTN